MASNHDLSLPPQLPRYGDTGRAAVADVLALLLARTRPLAPETVPLAAAAGRVLAEPVVSAVDVPAFPKSAMDGYAVRSVDLTADAVLAVPGESRPGRPYSGMLGPAQAVRIMTGAPLPTGADAVVPVEFTDFQPDGCIRLRQTVPAGRHVIRVGEDVAAGQQILPAGRVLRPQDVGLLAAVGIASVRVVRRPQVAALVTGDELLPPGSMPDGYRIVDSNSPMLAALVARDGGEWHGVTYLPDRFEVIREALAAANADVLLITGGTSVGAEDHTPAAVATVGELAIHGIAMRPAAPTGIGFLPGGRVAFLLPGNPVACLCAYDLFAGRLVRRLGGQSENWPYRVERVPAAVRLGSQAGRLDYVRVRLHNGAALPVPGGASRLSTVVEADGFVLIEPDQEAIEPGQLVDVYRYD